jgi:hypothetical protein
MVLRNVLGVVYSAFESWEVPRHSNLHVKLLIITSYGVFT